MTDRELMELAALAAGHQVEWREWRTGRIGNFGVVQYRKRSGFWLDGKEWNPLEDDGDALRLAVKLGLYLNIYTNTMHQTFAGHRLGVAEEAHNGDPYAATRRAITRAAAKIGKQMKENEQ